MLIPTQKQKAWVVAVDMGYGHMRAAFPLADIFQSPLINANHYLGITKRDEKFWAAQLAWYTRFSHLLDVPIIGIWLFQLFDRFQSIQPLRHTARDRRPNFQLRLVYRQLERGWMRDLIGKLNEHPLPLVTTFPVPAFAAELWNYGEEIYCLATDFEISRSWAPLDAKKTRIKYLAPTKEAQERLHRYGVPEKQIYLTGFPLPLNTLGGENAPNLGHDLAHRLTHLDPYKQFIVEHEAHVEEVLARKMPERSNKRVSLTFAIGGTGVQQQQVLEILRDLSRLVRIGILKITLVAGSRREVASAFESGVKELRLGGRLGKNLEILYEVDKLAYLERFSKLMRETDILWTKPSELSFYAGLGIPIVMASPVGSQEVYNRKALLRSGAGVDQPDSEGFGEWLSEKIDKGDFARMAWHGFREIEKLGVYNVYHIVAGDTGKQAVQ